MSLSSSLQISASGLTAERLRLDVISNNIANVNTTRGADGQPYRRQQVVFSARSEGGAFAAMLAAARGGMRNGQAPGAGVEVTAVQPDMAHDFKVVHDPGHPDADANGNVKLPNVEPVVEMVDMISASRAYEAGVTAINAAKQMQQRALEIGRAG
ncbi:MAG TPA: flagellar basal body rod protein FlgC [Chthonomonadaceae bacterium]|nr:flagellar basal body rod protein FlgC [Chthonomonadaceae bacterium]